MNCLQSLLVLCCFWLVDSLPLYLYEQEHLVVDLALQFGVGDYTFEGQQCASNGSMLVDLNRVIDKQPKKTAFQPWPTAPIIKTQFFESGNLVVSAGACLTEDLQIMLFSDNSYNMSNISAVLRLQSSYQLQFLECYDMRIYNQTLLLVCRNQTDLYLNIYELFLEEDYQLRLRKSHGLGIMDESKTRIGFYVQLNRDYLVLYQQETERFHMYRFANMSQIAYLSFPNVTAVINEPAAIVRVVFLYDDIANYTKYLAVLTSKQGVLVLSINSDGTLQLLDIIDPTPYGELYLDIYRETDMDVDQSMLYVVSNNFITQLQLSIRQDEAYATILAKHLIGYLSNVISYTVDEWHYYYVTHNQTTNVDDFIMVRRRSHSMMLYIPNFTGSYFTYDVNNAVRTGLRNRLRLLTFNPPDTSTQVDTYSFYDDYVNISASRLHEGVVSFACPLIFYARNKTVEYDLTILRKDQTDVLQRPNVILNENYIELQVTKQMRSYTDGPAPWYEIQSSSSNILEKSISQKYSLALNLSTVVELAYPLTFSRLLNIVDDDIVNLRQTVLVVQDSNKTIAMFTASEISGEIQTFSGKGFKCNLTIRQVINFQDVVIVKFEQQPDKVDLFRARDNGIEFLEEWRAKSPFGDTPAKYHYKVMLGFPRLITIIQEINTNTHAISVQITLLPSSYGSFNYFRHLPVAHVILESAADYYIHFQVEFLGNGALIGRTAGDVFHMFTVDLYMGAHSRLVSSYHAPTNSRIMFSFEKGQQSPVMLEVLAGKALTYDILSIDSEQTFVFAVGRQLRDFGFTLNSGELVYINNGFTVLEAARSGSSYLLAYKLNESNFDSLRLVLPKQPNTVYLAYDYPVSVGYQVGFCTAGFKREILTIACYEDPQLNMLMTSKSDDHLASLTVSYGSSLNPSQQSRITFGMDFVYEQVHLQLIKPEALYSPGSNILLEEYFRGPIENCEQASSPINYMSQTVKKFDFFIDDMCQHLNNLHNHKVSSKNWVFLLCGGGIWIIENNQNKTTKLSELTLNQVWGNPIRQFLTSEKWVMVGYNDDGFYRFIKETASWSGNFTPFSLIDFENKQFDPEGGIQKRILQFFVFVDLPSQLTLDFLLFQGYNCRNAIDRTIGIFLSNNNSQRHEQIYEFAAKDVGLDMLEASQLNVSCTDRPAPDTYNLVMTFKSKSSFLYVVNMRLTNKTLDILSIHQVNLSEELRKANIVPHPSQLFEYEMLQIDVKGCSFIVTTDFVIAGITVSLIDYSIELAHIYADYMGCRNQEAANQFGTLVALTCKFERDNSLYLKVYHRSDSPIVNITQFLELPKDIGDREYLDRLGWSFDVLEYGILLESYPFETTNFTYYFYSVNTSLAVQLQQHFGEVDLCCRNTFTVLCTTLLQDKSDPTLFEILIVAPLCLCVLILVAGLIYVKNYKQKMITWAENYTEQEY